jgi:bacterioferritin
LIEKRTVEKRRFGREEYSGAISDGFPLRTITIRKFPDSPCPATRHSSLFKTKFMGNATGKSDKSDELNISRERMIELLNEDLAREYQAIIAYIVYSKTMKGAAYSDIAGELEKHASEELDHALKIAQQIDYLGGTPVTTPKQVKTSDKAEDMLRFDLENERVTVENYRQRIRQAEAMGEFALSETLRGIIVQEQEHAIDLADALGIEVPR